jgi:PAS domain S-box-containing protein
VERFDGSAKADTSNRYIPVSERIGLGILMARFRWAAAGLSLVQALLVTPAPLSRGAVLMVTIGIAAYNLPAALCRRLPSRLQEPVIKLALIGDFLACTAWLMVNARDPYHASFLFYIVVAIEAAALYRWPGATAFAAAFLAALGIEFWQLTAAGATLPQGLFELQTAMVLIVAGFSAGIVTNAHRMGAAAAAGVEELARERQLLQREVVDRKQAEDARRVSEQQLRAIVRNAPIMLFAVDREGVITFSEGTGLVGFGNQPSQSLGFSIWDLYRHQPRALEKIREALLGRAAVAAFDEGERSFALSLAPMLEEGGHVVGAIGVSLDVTDRKEVERALEDQSELYRTLLKAQSDLGDLVIVSEDRKPVYMNPAVSSVSGYSSEELAGMDSLFDLVPVTERDAMKKAARSGSRPGSATRFEAAVIRKDGERVELEVAQMTVESGGRSRRVTIARDITHRKRIEQERRTLLDQLIAVQEEERQKIANDIHDDSIQTMFAVGIRLHLLRTMVKESEQLKLISNLESTVEHATARLRHLLFELRPVALDQEGLEAALRLYLEEMRTEARLEYELQSHLTSQPPPQARVVLYRITQEALANVRKHAGASRVEVSIGEADDGYLVSVADNGHGFDLEKAAQTVPGHLGLASMRERAEMLGGWFRLRSEPGGGTEVEFWIPGEVAIQNAA